MSDNVSVFSFFFSEAAGDGLSLPPNLNKVLSSPFDLLDEFVVVDMFNFDDCSSASLLKLCVSDRSVESLILRIGNLEARKSRADLPFKLSSAALAAAWLLSLASTSSDSSGSCVIGGLFTTRAFGYSCLHSFVSLKFSLCPSLNINTVKTCLALFPPWPETLARR